MTPRRRLWWIAAPAGFVLTVGLLHHPAAAPILRALSPASACPIARGSPAQIDRARAIGAVSLRSAAIDARRGAAPSRPALGFALDTTGAEEISGWAARHGVSCKPIGGNANLVRCASVPPAAVGQPEALGPLEEISFELSSRGVLVNVQTLRRGLTPEQASRVTSALAGEIEQKLGPPTTTAGATTPAHLGSATLRGYVAEHAFDDYRATIGATNLAHTGIMVREQYLSLR